MTTEFSRRRPAKGRFALWARRGLALVAVSLCPVVQAGPELGISPLRLDLPATRRSVELELANSGDRATLMRGHIRAWSQQNGASVLGDTTDLILVPPIVRLEAGKSQVLRVGRPLALKQAPVIEQTYRLVLTQVTDLESPSDDVAPPQAAEVEAVLSLSVPIFVQPQRVIVASQWSLESPSADGRQITVSVVNNGNVHRLFDSITLLDTNDKVIATASRRTYCLAGNRVTFPVTLDRPVSRDEMLYVRSTGDPAGETKAPVQWADHAGPTDRR